MIAEDDPLHYFLETPEEAEKVAARTRAANTWVANIQHALSAMEGTRARTQARQDARAALKAALAAEMAQRKEQSP